MRLWRGRTQTDNTPPGALADRQATSSAAGQLWSLSPSCWSTPGAHRKAGGRVLPNGEGQNLPGPNE